MVVDGMSRRKTQLAVRDGVVFWFGKRSLRVWEFMPEVVSWFDLLVREWTTYHQRPRRHLQRALFRLENE